MTTQAPHIKATRDDWLNVARDVLVDEGVGEVKILTLSARLKVSRSSFYWYFKNRDDLLNALQEEWAARNTRSITEACAHPAEAICEALCHFFECFIPPEPFDRGLDFAMRDWARRDAGIRKRIDAADAARIAAITAMYARFDYGPDEADARARILYYMQLGYHALEVRESMETRMSRLAPYLRGFTGKAPRTETLTRFRKLALKRENDARPPAKDA